MRKFHEQKAAFSRTEQEYEMKMASLEAVEAARMEEEVRQKQEAMDDRKRANRNDRERLVEQIKQLQVGTESMQYAYFYIDIG